MVLVMMLVTIMIISIYCVTPKHETANFFLVKYMLLERKLVKPKGYL